ncbi:MAG TPA: hypothetical protein VML75_16465 [Kofleriaceae bacterium]|nr:hypothetical protein [Kofleriaceae bacterium]
MAEDDSKHGTHRIDIDGVTLVWGDAATWKARLRAESLRRHLDKPVAERLLLALDLVHRRDPGSR